MVAALRAAARAPKAKGARLGTSGYSLFVKSYLKRPEAALLTTPQLRISAAAAAWRELSDEGATEWRQRAVAAFEAVQEDGAGAEAVAEAVAGGDDVGTLTVVEYKAYFKGEIASGVELPNVHTIMKRHGSWDRSCAAAGLRSRPDAEATRARKAWGFGSPTFSEADLLTAVTAYVADQATAGRKATVLGYHDWAVTASREGRRIPLSGAIRTRLIGNGKRFGSWPGLISHVRAP